MFISDRDGIINLQVPTSQQAADIDDNRPMDVPWPFFSVLRRLNQRRPWPGVSLPISFRCIALHTRVCVCVCVCVCVSIYM